MNWSQLWLDYKKDDQYLDKEFLEQITCKENSKILKSAVCELQAFREKTFQISNKIQNENKKQGICLQKIDDNTLSKEGFIIRQEGHDVMVEANADAGILYGVYYLIRHIMQKKPLRGMYIKENPCFSYRMLDHWDNIDGSIERGYSGKSFFFENGEILINDRTKDYARLMASIGINQVAINNVNVKANAVYFVTNDYLKKLKEIADIFEQYAIRLFLCVDFAAPITVGKMETADPLEENVQKWWKECANNLYKEIPQFGGFLVKADSEGRPGPFYYKRNHADGANMLAQALKPHKGTVIWRCFVYDCKQDWRDTKSDRAKAAYDTFLPIDGQFEDNVILQIKNGPMDFQVREPVSPLFGGLEKTNQMLELQIAQEYTGQQIDVCYLVPMWKEILSFQTHCKEENDTVADIISGKTFGHTECGIAAVANTGNDYNWTGNDLAAANLFGYGRLAWDSKLDATEIAKEWIACTFGLDEEVSNQISLILMKSWPAYEKYTTPYGCGWMVTPHTHYGPSVEGYEYDVWGTYHRANKEAIGVDRTENGTGYALQYKNKLALQYSNIETCPEELLLFFHRVNYDRVLKNKKTLLQNIYSLHFEGVEEVETMKECWNGLNGKVPQGIFERVSERFERQYENSKNWRDIVNTYFYRKTLIKDEKQRVIYD